MKPVRWGLVVAVGAAILVLGGCGYFSGLFSGNQGTVPSADEVWVDHGVWAEAELSPLALEGEKPETPRFVPGQLIVEFKPGKFTDPAINALCSKHGVQLRGRINKLRLVLVTLPAGLALETAKANVEAEPDVQSVGLNYVYELFSQPQVVGPKAITNDPYYDRQWGMRQIGFNRIASSTLPTTGPIIAVVDTGVDYDHPDLKGKVIKGPDYFDGDMDPMDTTGHGTHVAGITAAFNNNNVGVAGVSGPSRVLAIRVGRWWIPTFAGAAGIVYAADYPGVKVINLSWGGPFDSRYIRAAVEYTVGKGILVVAAAGNWDATELMYPAAYDNVLAVGATEWEDRKACFSNYGDYVDIAAPGVSIYSTFSRRSEWWGGSPPDYTWMSGTSMASPFVAGAAALVWGKWPEMIRAAVADLLTTTGDPVFPDECAGHAFPEGVKRLNVYNAFAARMTMPPPGGAISGRVTHALAGVPISDATVTATNGTTTRTARTRADGTYTITDLPAGSYRITASKDGFVPRTREEIWVTDEEVTWVDIALSPDPNAGRPGTINGQVIDANTGRPLSGATVTARAGRTSRTARTRADGMYSITRLPAGTYSVSASRSGYVTTTAEVTVGGGASSDAHFALPRVQAQNVYTVVVQWTRVEMGESGHMNSYLWLPEQLPEHLRYIVNPWDKGNLAAHPYAQCMRDEPWEAPPGRAFFAEVIVFRTHYAGANHHYYYAVEGYDWRTYRPVVRLYKGSALVWTFEVPQGDGSWWAVFKVDANTGAVSRWLESLVHHYPGPYSED